MTAEHVRTVPGAYADSLTLMQASARAQAVPGVRAALVAMATELNLDLLAGLGITVPEGAGPTDLLVAVSARDGASLAAALAVVDDSLAGGATDGAAGGAAGSAGTAPRTTFSAIRRAGPGVALISVPGEHAFADAMDAIEAGCDVMIFSDHVPVGQEIALKDAAAERGLLVMGPDCGTAIVAGVGLGFSHSVRPGPVGLVAASGTGAQQVVCLLDAAGAGVSAVIGIGGRDLSAAVGGRSARAALAALDEDPATELILVVSKPPDGRVAAGLREHARRLVTPVQFAFAGETDLTTAAESALRAIGLPVPGWPRWNPGAQGAGRPRGPAGPGSAGSGTRPSAGSRPGTGVLRGLFAGGTLCEEAAAIAAGRLGPVYSNVPLRPEWAIGPHEPAGRRHVVIDFGDDEFTAGRPHPMIDQRLRIARLAAEAADPDVGVILLDVVLGHGAHPDPAAELAPAIGAATRGTGEPARATASGTTAGERTAGAPPGTGGVPVVVALIGARSDPQGLGAQAEALARAGAAVFASNARAAERACELIARGGGPSQASPAEAES